ncbi:hypothetical protein Ahy_B09g099379 [Arachis hypogaea]|uniref:Protein FAR1-RELATED SEQUENCE n=1 Tax=Arachis hypogaea TaxID=3818 RepID=A0A444XTR4_ARAHY|nr:hypothetical protein Ahy_B09g099379 [Arachis hypogaea]
MNESTSNQLNECDLDNSSEMHQFDEAEMLKQHRELTMFVHHTIETHEKAGIRPSKTYQSFVVAAGSHRELGFIEIDVRNYITRKVQNIFEEDDAKEFGNREQAERELDAADFHTVIPCTTKSAIEAQFHHVYTHEKFREVQAQFRGKVSCITRSMHSTLGFTTYEVIEQVSNSTFNKFVVTYDAESQDVKCHCLLFESRGILCRHSLSVLSFERSEELTGILHRAFDKVMAEMEEYQERSKEKSLLTHEEATLSNMNDLQNPPRVKTRVQLKNRLGSNLEKKISNTMKKKKKTALSELNLSDFGSSIQSSSTLYNAPDMNYPREDCTSFSFY